MNKNLYLDLHVLQTVPVSNINRDDTNSPKTALYGGVMRSRVSSQSWKHAMRALFKEHGIANSFRTIYAPQVIIDEIKKLDSSIDDDVAGTIVKNIFKATDKKAGSGIKLKTDSKNDGDMQDQNNTDDNNENEDLTTKALLMISPAQIKALAQYGVDTPELRTVRNFKAKLPVKKAIQDLFNNQRTLDLALFGRMVADNANLSVEAAAQVAHAISTHEIVPEFDYYTALDDLQKEDKSGANMVGATEFNSSTLYRYANLNINELEHNLGKPQTLTGISEYIRDFVLSMPKGKQNSFANKTLPFYVMATLRTDTPVNLVSAFERPVKEEDGYEQASLDKFEREFTDTLHFVKPPISSITVSKYDTKVGEPILNIEKLCEKINQDVEKVLSDEIIND